MPRNAISGMSIGLSAAMAAFGLVWGMWWLAVVSVELIVAAVVLRSFGRGQHRTISARQVAAEHDAWLALVHATPPTPRQTEMSDANRGRAEIKA